MTEMNASHPYTDLTPDRVMDAL
ncbi:MAG: hypothetical protein RLZZ280_797, partial [Pseudomonadota bacterium]